MCMHVKYDVMVYMCAVLDKMDSSVVIDPILSELSGFWAASASLEQQDEHD